MMEMYSIVSNFPPITTNIVIFCIVFKLIQKLSWLTHKAYRDPRQPPFVPYVLPYVGSAFSFKKDPHAFISKWCRHFQSPVISAYIAGRVFIFIQDSSLINYYTSGRIPELAWKDLKMKIVRNAMSVSENGAETIAKTVEEHSMLDKHLLAKESLKDIAKNFQIAIQTKWLPKFTSNEQHDSDTKENASQSENTWSSQSILDFFGKMLYLTNMDTLFGCPSMATDEYFQHSMNFDRSVINLFKTALDKQAKDEPLGHHSREVLLNKVLSIQKNMNNTNISGKNQTVDNPTPLMRDMTNLYKGKLDENDLSKRKLSLHWASFTNAIPTVFWTVFNLLSHKEAYEAILKEVRSIHEEKVKDHQSKSSQSSSQENDIFLFTLEDIDRMSNLHSILMETIRLTTTQKAVRARYANKDFELQLPLQGKGKKNLKFHVKKDTMFMSSTTLQHRDMEVFDNPLEFQWDRFVSQTKFTKNGRTITQPVNPFGSGISMCPGRKFALMEIKSIIAAVLVDFDVRFPEGVSKVDPPSLHATKGVASTSFPASDVSFELRKKS